MRPNQRTCNLAPWSLPYLPPSALRLRKTKEVIFELGLQSEDSHHLLAIRPRIKGRFIAFLGATPQKARSRTKQRSRMKRHRD